MASDAPIVCLMGPTASGKTACAIRLVDAFPFDIVSVDSALVYRGMDIGTAKPDTATLARAPHRLIDIREPEAAYSAGQFVKDARREIESIRAAGRVPLLVGGTMLYFRALMQGIADLPEANPAVRRVIDREAEARGWPAMHAELARLDPEAAARIKPNDKQRIQRALEVFRVSGRPLSELQAAARPSASAETFVPLALVDGQRDDLHRRIDARFLDMIDGGFVEEVQRLRERPRLDRDSPAMRAVGYRQLWAHLAGEMDLPTAIARGQAATRQLAKRQLTWLNSLPALPCFDPLEAGTDAAISELIRRSL